MAQWVRLSPCPRWGLLKVWDPEVCLPLPIWKLEAQFVEKVLGQEPMSNEGQEWGWRLMKLYSLPPWPGPEAEVTSRPPWVLGPLPTWLTSLPTTVMRFGPNISVVSPSFRLPCSLSFFSA